jgi:hypothetical protein
MSRRLALIVGNSRYDDPGLASLCAPDVDVRELSEALRGPDVGQFDEVIQLVDETSPTVRRAIAQLFHLKRREDLVHLYVAHGQFLQTGRPYIYTFFKNADINTGTAQRADLTSLWDFQEELKSLGHFYSRYDNIDQLKRMFRDQLDKL